MNASQLATAEAAESTAKNAAAIAATAAAVAADASTGASTGGGGISIAIGNWTKYLLSLGWSDNAKFIVGGAGQEADPAPGCAKQFSANYQCGTGPTKSINIAAEAGGKTALFDCTAENAMCLGFRLTLGDTGNLVLTDNTGATVWQSNTTTTGIAMPEYNAVSGQNGRNYLMSGESLFEGAFIGSPSGNCWLIMPELTSPTALNSLQIQYSVSSCSGPVGAWTGNDDTAYGLYSIPATDISSIGSVGYLDKSGKTHAYPANMVGPAKTYTNIGHYDSYGNDIGAYYGTSPKSCETACNGEAGCAGFIWDESAKICFLKNTNMFPNAPRQTRAGYDLYVQDKSVTNGSSCTKEVETGTAAQWELLPTTTKMSMDTLCNIGMANKSELANLAKKEQKVNNTLNTMNNTYNTLISENTSLRNNFNSNIKGIKKDIHHMKTIHKKTKREKVDTNNVDGMMEDSDLSLISQNYKYLWWSILAILIISMGIKVVRNNSS